MNPRRGTRLRDQPLRFTFDGRAYEGQVGDTAASALLANDVWAFGRSVKYRRLRGVLGAGVEEPNALLTVGTAPSQVPNTPATTLALRDGMTLFSQNRWPSLRWNVSSVLRLGKGMLGSGFYYKTFIWPSWHVHEGMIRRLAGLGPAPGRCDLEVPAVQHLGCDVLVVGGGVAGLVAARTLHRAGFAVILCEREPVCGGELEFETSIIENLPALEWVKQVLQELEAGGARVFTRMALVHLAPEGMIAHGESVSTSHPQVLHLHPHHVVLATGAIERTIAFVGNDLPGVMLLGAAEALAARQGVRLAQRAVLFGNHDRLYAAARRLRSLGIGIRAIVDTREAIRRPPCDDLIEAGIRCHAAHGLMAAQGRRRVCGAFVAPLASPDAGFRIDCDAIFMSGGWNAMTRLSWEPGSPAPLACGAAHGAFDLAAAIGDGHRTALEVARLLGRSIAGSAAPACQGDPEAHVEPVWRMPCSRRKESLQFVDFQNDVTVSDLRQAHLEGFRDIEHVKRYTTLGVGTDQGRTSGAPGTAILAQFCGRDPPAAHSFRPRPPIQPATLNSICGLKQGRWLRPERRTALHAWHVSNGAVMEASGLWMRPRFYRANGAEAAAAGQVEAARVRREAGMVDASTLGKIGIAGPDAAAFLDRLYLTRASSLKIGRARYMVMLREDGMVLDDGLLLRLAADRFVATVSTGHADAVLSHLEFWRAVEFGNRAVALADLTECWSVIAVSGPASRDRLVGVLGNDWSGPVQSLSHMQFSCGDYLGMPLRVLRASFSGELAFELHVHPAATRALWEALQAAAVTPYGLEALDILRVEKGYLTGSEMNGQTTPQDLGLQAFLKSGNDCIGRSLLDRPAFADPARPRLVGLQSVNPEEPFFSGAQLTQTHQTRGSAGHVTSSVYSPALRMWLGLALLSRQIDEGCEVMARDPLHGRNTRVRVVLPVHLDPEGSRMRA